jgi:hypothetical protein
MEMDRSRVKTIGFSIMRQPGPFCLEIESIKAVNTATTLGDVDIMNDMDVPLKRTNLLEALKREVRFFEDPVTPPSKK